MQMLGSRNVWVIIGHVSIRAASSLLQASFRFIFYMEKAPAVALRMSHSTSILVCVPLSAPLPRLGDSPTIALFKAPWSRAGDGMSKTPAAEPGMWEAEGQHKANLVPTAGVLRASACSRLVGIPSTAQPRGRWIWWLHHPAGFYFGCLSHKKRLRWENLPEWEERRCIPNAWGCCTEAHLALFGNSPFEAVCVTEDGFAGPCHERVKQPHGAGWTPENWSKSHTEADSSEQGHFWKAFESTSRNVHPQTRRDPSSYHPRSHARRGLCS